MIYNYLYPAAEHPNIDDPHAAKSISSIMRTVSATAQPPQTMNSGVLRTPSQANGYSSRL
jgi:hypothetical protein